MEKSKINSKDLIEKSGGGDAIFDAINSPTGNVFSLQRFANIDISQASNKISMSAEDKLSNHLYAGTLGRSSNTYVEKATKYIAFKTSSDTFQIAPLAIKTGTSQTYTINAYTIDASNTRLAISSAGLKPFSDTYLANSWGYYAGIAVHSDTSAIDVQTTNLSSADNTYHLFSSTYVTGTGGNKGYSTEFGGATDSYTGVWFNISNASKWLGSNTAAVIVDNRGKVPMTYTLDFYDVKLAAGTHAVGGATTGSYTANFAATQQILFASESDTLSFSSVDKTTAETYHLNGVDVVLTGKGAEANNSATLVVNSYKAGTYSFGDVGVNSNVSMAFAFSKDVNSIAIGADTYSVSNNSGTVAFSMLDNNAAKTITLGADGSFTGLSSAANTAFGLESGTKKATQAIFSVSTANPLLLDVDGFSADAYKVMSFTASGEASILGKGSSSELTILNGTVSASGTDMYKLGYTLSDAAKLTVGEYTFADVQDGPSTSHIAFTTISDLTVTGALNLTMSATSQFAVTANDAAYHVSNTSTAAAAYIQFDADSNTLTMGSSVAIAGTFKDVILAQKGGDILVNGGTTYSFTVDGTYNENKNKVSFFKGEGIGSDTSHVFTPAKGITNVNGVIFGTNIKGGSAPINVTGPQVYDSYYFGGGNDANSSGTATFSSTGIVLSGKGILEISGVSDSKLVGVTSETFLVTGAGATFYVKDNAEALEIGGITFSELQDDSITKLAYTTTSSEMTIFGNLSVTAGSNTKMNYLLGSSTSVYDTNSIAFGGLRFVGSGTKAADAIVGVSTSSIFNLTADAYIGVSGTSKAATTYALQKNSSGTFTFGVVSIGASGTGLANVVNVTGIDDEELGADASSATFAINGGEFSIADAAQSASFKVSALSGGLFAISDIDGGATLYSVASTTKVIANGFDANAEFVFSGTQALSTSASGKAYQKFTFASKDDNGVVFNLDSATGLVTSISGYSGGKVTVEDLTAGGARTTWTRNITGGWNSSSTTTLSSGGVYWGDNNVYLEYIVGNNGTNFTQEGVASTTNKEHVTLTDFVIGTSDTNKFTLNSTAIDGTATSVFFTNKGTTGYDAYSGTTKLFGSLKTTANGTSNTGVIFSAGGLSFGTIGASGTANALTALTDLGDNGNISAMLAASEMSVVGDSLVVSGTGVTLTAKSAGITVDGGNPYVLANIPNIGIGFGSNTGVASVHSNSTLRHAFTFDASDATGALAATGTNSSIFAINVLPGVLVSDTLTKVATNGESSLTVNNITFGVAGGDSASGTLVFKAGASGASTSTFAVGTFTIDSYDNATNTTLGFAKGAGLLFTGYSYTGKADTTSFMTLGGDSASQVASVSSGTVTAQLADNKTFTFWLNNVSSTFTASSGGVTYDLLSTSAKNAMVGGSATGFLRSVGQHSIAVLSDTFMMQSGSSVVLTYGDTYKAESATTVYRDGTGSNTFATFALSDFYMASGTGRTSADTKIYSYTSSTAPVSLSLSFTDGTETLKITSGQATRSTSTLLNNTFKFNGTPYSATGSAFTFMIDSSISKAEGTFYAGAGSRSYTGGTTTELAAISFNSDTYTYFNDAIVGLNVVAGKGTETFVSGSATFMADSGKTFHFDINGSETSGGLNAYSATKTLYLNAGGFSVTESNTTVKTIGQLYSIMDGSGTSAEAITGIIGTRLSTLDETHTFLADSYTVAADATLGLKIDANLGASETVTLGTATYVAGAEGVFHIDKAWAGSSIKLTDFVGDKTYSYTAVSGATLNMYIDGASYTQKIASGYGTRQAESSTFTFNKLTYSSTGKALTFWINSDSKTAEGSFYGGIGSRLYNGVTSTSLAALTLGYNTYTTFVDATLQVEVDALQIKGGSETFVSGSATFTAAASNGTFWAVASGTSNPVQYTAIENVAISAGFSNSATGVVYAASGKGIRTFDGTENFTFTLGALSDTFKMTAGNATITLSNTTLTASNNVAYGIAEATSGTGVMYLNPMAGTGSSTTFALSDKYFKGGADATPYVYTASTTGTLTLNMQSADSQTLTMGTGLVGWRSSGTTGTEFIFDPDGNGDIPEQTYYLQSAATYTVDSAAASASGKVFAAVATRSYDFATDGTNTTAQPISFRGDNYTASQGILTLNIVNGVAQSETFTSGSATYTVGLHDGFLFNINDFTTTDTTKLNSYSATSAVALTIGIDANGSATGIVSATGSGTRVLSAENTYAQGFTELGGNTYIFTEGTVQLTMKGATDVADNFSESIDSGTGTFTPIANGETATAIVRFDKDGNFTGNAYSYTSFAAATTFTIGYASGTIKTQSITGTATRSNQSDATFVYGGKTYSSTSKSDSTSAAGQLAFVLSTENTATYGAQGIFTEGFGFRVQEGAVNYSDTKYAKANVYSITGAEFKLSSSNSTISESLYHGSGSNTFTNNTAFYYLGTEYTASGTAKMNLNAVSGVVSETLTEGAGIFDSSDSSVTFEYGGNMYHVSGTAKLSITAKDPKPVFQEGMGVKDLVLGVSGSDTFVYTDQNTYTLTSTNGQLIAQAKKDENDSTTAVVRFLDATAKAEDKIAESKPFYFDPANIEGTETKLYTAFGGDVVLKLRGVADINASANVPEFDSGSATRVDNTVTTFEFDGITYTSTATADAGITFMLTAGSNSETTYVGTGSRGIENAASFTFLSPLTNGMASYTATAPVTFGLTVTAGVGSETFVSGSATRTLEAGTAFTFEVNNETRNYTVSGTGITTLTPKASGSGSGGLLGLTGYDPSSAQEILTDVNANRTESTTFVYKSIVTNSDTTYTASGNVIINDVFKDDAIVAGSSTWVSGTGTMSLAATTEFTYYLDGTTSHTYKAAADGAGFTRVSQTGEFLTSGYGTRDAVAGDVANFTYTYLADTYTAAVGGSIALSGTGKLEATDAKETYSTGSATFTALAADSGQFHFVVDGTTNTYTASSDVTFTAEVKNGTPDYANIVATGAGTRAYSTASDTYKPVILGDTYDITEGTFTLDFANVGYANASETLTAGAGQFVASATKEFHVSDKYFGISTDKTSYTYVALANTTLGLEIKNGSETIISLSGIGTRSATDTTISQFEVNGTKHDYASATDIFYAISTTSKASGYLYSGFGTRLTAEGESSATTVFNYDTFTVAAGATMVLTISSGTGVEKMTQGTGTYTAKATELFHFGNNAYTALNSGAVLTINMGAGATDGLTSITGSGTRLANTADNLESFSTTYQEDTYYAVAGSSTFMFTAAGAIDSTGETLVTTTGYVRHAVNNDVFHTNNTAYTASGTFTINLALGESESVQNFVGTVDAYRTASDTTFVYVDPSGTSKTYDLKTGTYETYSLASTSNTGVLSDLTEKLFAAEGTRVADSSETYVSNWKNTYTLTDGTYSIAVENTSGTEKFTAGTGKAEYAAGGDLQYGGSTTAYAYIANLNNATLGLTTSDGNETEKLTAGAINFVDGSSATYIIASEGFTVGGAGENVTLTAPDASSETLVTVKTTNNYITSADYSLSGAFASGGKLNVNEHVFTANAEGALNIDKSLVSFEATSGTFGAEGEFTGGITLSKDVVNVSGDSDILVTFADSTVGVTALASLTNGATIVNAAGATKALTDSTGTFIFQSTATGDYAPAGNKQTFNVSGDSEVTFKLDSSTGLVVGISGLDTGAEISIVDTGAAENPQITGDGQILERGSDGTWTTSTVIAEAYLVSVTSSDEFNIYAIDDSGTPTKINNERLAGVTTDSSTITLNFASGNDGSATTIAKGIYVVNQGSKVINTDLISGISKTTDNDAAVKITSDANVVSAGILDSASGYAYTEKQSYTIENGKFSIDAEGGVDVGASITSTPVVIAANDGASVDFVATTDTAQFQMSEDESPVTLTIGDTDSDSVGNFGAVYSENKLSGLNPSGVDTGTAVVESSNDSDVTSFAIGTATVSISNDNDGDGMTLAIEKNSLVGISAVSTDATINVSGLADNTTLTVGEDNVTLTSGDEIKHNKTLDKWISGEALSIEAAAYLVSVDSANNNQVKLWVTPKDATDTTKQTTNRADYVAVFGSALAPTQDDGDLPEYSDGITIQSDVASIPVSIVSSTNSEAGISVTYADSAEDASKDLILTTANGYYTVNGQEIIPSALATVTALSNTAAQATLSATTSIGHGGMTFNATTDTAVAVFGDDITLTDKAKVTNTAETATFLTNGTVTFDSIAVVGSSAAISGVKSTTLTSGDGSGFTANGIMDLNVAGGDLAYTVNVTDSTAPIISGIDAGSTVSGLMANDAYILTASEGNFKIAESDIFSISGDDEVKFQTSDTKVVAIESLSGSVGGNFADTVTVDGGIVKVVGDTSILVSANDTVVSEISNVGADAADVTIANAGGATLVNTDANGGFYFGESDTHYFKVSDADSVVSFITAKLANDVPTVNGVQGINNGTIEIGQAESGFLINSDRVTLGEVSDNVTVTAASDSIVAVSGLQGLVNGLQAGVLVGVVDSDVTINGAALQVNEGSGSATLAVNTTADGFDTVTGLNKDAVVTTAKNAYLVTEDEGAYTFNSNVSSLSADTYTITGDSSVTFETDENSRVKNIGDFAGTLNATTARNTVNGAVVEVAKADSDAAVSDVSITSAGSGVSSVLGLGNNDSVTVPVGTHAQMPASASSDTATTLTVNGKPYALAGDADGVDIIHGSSIDTITTLAGNASLTVGAAGSYYVNDTLLSANIGDVIIGDPEGSAHVYDESDFDLNENSTTEDALKRITGLSSEDGSDRYVKNLDAENSQKLLDAAKEDPTVLDGNIEMTLGSGEDSDAAATALPLDFSNTTGIKKINMTGDQAADIAFNNAGGNIAVIEDGATGAKNITLGDGGDIAVIGEVDGTVNLTTGAGRDQIVTKATHASINMRKGGAARIMPTKGIVDLDGYDANTGAGIQVNNSSIKKAIAENAIQLNNGEVIVNNGARVTVNPNAEAAGSTTVNFFNLKGFMTKVGYTHEDGGEIDFSTETRDVVMKGNFTTGGASSKNYGSVMRSGVGNDAAFGGAGDTFNLGAGENEITIDSNNHDTGAVIEQTATSGRTEVTGFNFNYSDMGDRVNINVNAGVSFKNNKLTFTLGLATLILNGATGSSSSDLATSADGEDASKIGTEGSGSSQKVLINDGGRLEVAKEDAVIKVERDDGQLTQAYYGENSGVNLGAFEESAMVNLNANTGTFAGEATFFNGINKLQGGSGEHTLIGNGADNNTIAAGSGNNSVWGGGASNDSLYGDSGDSTKSGSSSFFYMTGDGRDTINNFEFLTADNSSEGTADKINVLRTPIVTGVEIDSSDVILSLSDENDKLRIANGVGKDFYFEFTNNEGEHTLTAQINTSTLRYDGRANYFHAMNKNAEIVADSLEGGVNIWLNNRGLDTFVGDFKVLNAQAVQGEALLVGNSNDNAIYAGSGNSSMWGAEGGNDTLVGGEGTDWFWYGKNNGNDFVSNVGENDVVNLYDLTLADVESADTSNTSSITVYLKDSVGGGNVTVQDNATGVGFRLNDGTTWAYDRQTRNWYTK